MRRPLPGSVREAIRQSLGAQLRAVAASLRQTEARQAELVEGLIDAREQGFPLVEVERPRADAIAVGFSPSEFEALLVVTGWRPKP